MRRSSWDQTPRQSIEAEARRRGPEALVVGCLRLLHGLEVDGDLVRALGGPPAARWAEPGAASGPDYWLRVWALRGLLWVWREEAAATVVDALADEVWRVRELAAKVVARHRVDDALEALTRLRDDPVDRVRTTAERALVRLATQ